jgi:hypothetical protein
VVKGLLIFGVTLLCAAGLARANQDGTNSAAESGSWSGIIINSNCTPDQAFAEAAECMQSVPGAKLSFYDDTTRQIYNLDPQEQAAGHLGDAVTVHGALAGNTIQVTSLELLTAIGLPVGEKAPPLSARDQFGREQNLDTLRGPHGTVLLFFRSADW